MPNRYVTAAEVRRAITLLTVVVPTLAVPAALYLIVTTGVTATEIALLLTMHVLAVGGVEMGFHRYFSHRSFKAGPKLEVLLGVCGSLAAQGPLMQWVCDHRKHHRYADRDGDPHSPVAPAGSLMRRLWHAHLGWLFVREMHDPTAYATDILRKPTVMQVSQAYHLWVLAGIVLPGFGLAAVDEWTWTNFGRGMLFGGLLRISIGHHAVWAVNSFGHSFGMRPFQTREQSRNNLWLVLPTLGGGWHNNHHAYPASAINSVAWWQIDPVGLFIRLLGKLNLISEIRTISDSPRDSIRDASYENGIRP